MFRCSLAEYTKGFAETAARLRGLPKDFLARAAKALYGEGLGIQALSMQRTPVLTGALRASHDTSITGLGTEELKVSVSVGGPSAPYAWYVHENLEAHHDNGQAKFLESAHNERMAGMAERLAAAIRK